MRRFLGAALLSLVAGLVHADADLSVTKSDSPDPVVMGAGITFTVLVANIGPSDASNIVLSDTLPSSVTFQSISVPNEWACSTPPADSTGTISCTATSLAAGMTSTIIIVGKPASAGLVSNMVNVLGAEPDPVPENNSATQETMILAADVP
jgi:uncharacterized repeat protein (TIGR01451 family)